MYIKQILNDVGVCFSILGALLDTYLTKPFIVSWMIYLWHKIVYSGCFCMMEFLIALKLINQVAKTYCLSQHKNNVIIITYSL